MNVPPADQEPREPGAGAPPPDGESLALRDAPASAHEPPPRRSPAVWIAVVAVIAAAALAGSLYLTRRGAVPVATDAVAAGPTTAPLAAVAPPPQRLGGDVPPVDLPPLDQSDAAVTALVRSLSSHPRVAAWLTTTGLVRSFVVVVENLSRGRTPAAQLQALHLSEGFRVVERQGGMTVDARSYRRYDPIAAAVASVDPPGAARLYATLRPRIDEAYRDLGNPDAQFDAVLEKAIVLLLQTAVPDSDPRLVRAPKGVAYLYADPRLEALAPAQKQLLRMGPDNVRRIQSSLRAIGLALGIPAARLDRSR